MAAGSRVSGDEIGDLEHHRAALEHIANLELGLGPAHGAPFSKVG